jgi:uncharacterized protein
MITIFFALWLPQLKVENISEKFGLSKDDPLLHDLKLLDSLFGSYQYIYLGIHSPDGLNKEILHTVGIITDRIRQADYASDVISLTNAERVVWVPYFDSFIPQTRPLVTETPNLNTLTSRLLSSPLYLNNIISNDLHRFNIIIQLKQIVSVDEIRKIKDDITQVCSPYNQYNFYLAGTPLIDEKLSDIVNNDLKTFALFSLGISIAVLFFFFRNITAVFLAVSVALVSLVCSLGLLSLTGTPLSVSLSAIILLIIVISIAYSVHYLDLYFIHSKFDDNALLKLIKVLLIPSLLTGLTTSAGFFSLLVSDFVGIREVGLFVGIGIIFCMIMNNVLLPSLLFHIPRPSSRKNPGISYSVRISDVLQRFAFRRTNLIIFFFIFLILASIVGITLLKQDTNHLHYIREDEPIRQGFDFIDTHFGGALSVEYLVNSDKNNYSKSIGKIDNFGKALKSLAEVGSVLSVADVLAMINSAKPQYVDTGFNFDYYNDKFPDNIIESISKSKTGKNFVFVNDSSFTFRILARVNTTGSSELENFIFKANNLIVQHLHNENVITTGIIPYFIRNNEYIIKNQISSFSIAFILVLSVLLLITSSFKLGLLALIPNVFPVLFVMGVMGWLSIPLDISNVMIASIAMGIIVDDSIHFLYRFKSGTVSSTEAKIKTVYHYTGSPIIITSLVLASGFLVMSFSDFVPTSQFGLLSGIVVILALLADLLVLPALLLKSEN